MIDNELAAMWDSAEVVEGGDFAPIPDGKYKAIVDKCQFTRTKETDHPMFAWTFIIKEGQQNGRHVFLNRVLRKDFPDSVKFAKTDFARVGLKANSFAEFITMLGEVLDKTVEIQLKTKKLQDGKEVQNVYINKLITGAEQFGEEAPVW